MTYLTDSWQQKASLHRRAKLGWPNNDTIRETVGEHTEQGRNTISEEGTWRRKAQREYHGSVVRYYKPGRFAQRNRQASRTNPNSKFRVRSAIQSITEASISSEDLFNGWSVVVKPRHHAQSPPPKKQLRPHWGTASCSSSCEMTDANAPGSCVCAFALDP